MLYGQQPDWQRLYVKGRCRAIGVSWTDEEDILISKATTDVDRENIIAKLRADKTGVTHNFEEFAIQPKKVEEIEKIEMIIDENEGIDGTKYTEELEARVKQFEPTETSQKEVEINLDEQTIQQLRVIYTEKFGKKPFNGFDKEKIIQLLIA